MLEADAEHIAQHVLMAIAGNIEYREVDPERTAARANESGSHSVAR